LEKASTVSHFQVGRVKWSAFEGKTQGIKFTRGLCRNGELKSDENQH